MIARSLGLIAFASAGFLAQAGGAIAEGKLFIYNWTDYTAPDLIAKFEKETGIAVTLDTYDSNETLLAKLQSGATGYDIVVPSHNFVPIFIQEKLLMPIEAQKLPGYENLADTLKGPEWDPDNTYTVPWQWGSTSFAVDTAVFKGDVDNYDVLFKPPAELQGQIGMLKSSDDAINMALLALEKPLCSEDPKDLQVVMDLLKAQKPFVKTYNSDGTIERLASGDVLEHQTWSGATLRARTEKASIRYAYPPQGVLGWADNVAIPVGAPDYDNAIRFIEFIMQPENIAIQSNFAAYANGVKGSGEFMKPELRDAPEVNPPEGKKVVFTHTCSPKSTDLYNRVWTALFQ